MLSHVITATASFAAGVVLTLLFAGKVITVIRAEFSAVHEKFDAVVDALKK